MVEEPPKLGEKTERTGMDLKTVMDLSKVSSFLNPSGPPPHSTQPLYTRHIQVNLLAIIDLI
jgi:hypothetical protein